MNGSSTVTLLLVLFLSNWLVIADDYTELCSLFQDGTNLRYPGSCTQYISCESTSPAVYSCFTPTVYDNNQEGCVDFEAAAGNNYCRNRCEGLHNQWVSDPTNCNGYYYCYEGASLQGYCSPGYQFSQTKQMCVFDTDSTCVGVSSMCELVADGTKFRDETDCSKYYQCSKGVLTNESCKKDLYFDVEQNKCDTKTLVECTAHPSPKCSTGSGKNEKVFTGYISDGATCRGYFFCKNFDGLQDLDPQWYQCPEGKFFSDSSKSGPCVDPIDAACTYNRCDTRGTMLVQSSSNDCHDFIQCEDGTAVNTFSCTGDMFFDEKLQACVYYPVYYKACDGLL